MTSYGELTPVESYHPPMPPLLASPKRYAHGCLRLRLPVRRPPMPNRSTITHGGYGGWSRLVIGGDAVSYFIYHSLMRIHLTLPLLYQSPMSPKVPLIRSPISPSTPTLVVANMTSLSIVPPSPAPASPLPLPTRPRSSPYTTPFRAYLTVSSDPTSDSETENELESHDDGDTTCVSESDPEDDGSGKAWLKTNLAGSTLSLRK